MTAPVEHAESCASLHAGSFAYGLENSAGDSPCDCGAVCSIEDCERPVRARTWCATHHSRWLRHGDPLVVGSKRNLTVTKTPWQERIWAKVDKTGDCWLWTAGKTGSGYGEISEGGADGRTLLAHRCVYELMVGQIPEGLQLDHLCRVRHCVNPEHLEPVTASINSLRGETLPAANAVKTHCPQGHPYDDENTYHWPRRDGRSRGCKRCRAAHRDAWRARQKVAS